MNSSTRAIPGVLTLIPSPIDDESPLEQTAFALLNHAAADTAKNIIVIEDHKPARRRWLHWGLPREAIAEFTQLNEHNFKTSSQLLLNKLRSGMNVYLLSDCGLPAFCDPGRELVDLCHQAQVMVQSSPFCNSISLAIAVSGIDCGQFYFAGFLPRKTAERNERLKELTQLRCPVVMMDTPYRLINLLQQLKEVVPLKTEVFLAINLNKSSQQLLKGKIDSLIKRIKNDKGNEFILIFDPFSKAIK